MKKINKILALSLCSLMLFGNYNKQRTDVVNCSTIDEINEMGKIEKVSLNKLANGDTYSYSKMFSQYGFDGTNYYLRFATAVKGNITSLTYSMSMLEDNYSKEVTLLYKGILANDQIYYYDDTIQDLTTEKSDYVWACYTLKFLSDQHLSDTLNVELKINNVDSVTKTTSLEIEKNLDHQHDLTLIEAKEATCLEDGNETYYKCNDLSCGKLFLDSEGKHEATLEDVTIAKLGHNMVSNGDYKDLHCTRCDYHGYIYELESARSNAWVGGEYNDKLWKIAASGKVGTSGEYYVGRVNDNSVDSDLKGKTWLEFDVVASEKAVGTLKVRAALGVRNLYKKSLKVTVNNHEIDVGEETFDSNYGDWQHWELFDYADISLEQGLNTIRLTIMENTTCDLDYAFVEANTTLNKHQLVLKHDETYHWMGCEDCDFEANKELHVFDQEIATEEYHLESNKYYKSCKCGQKGTETFEIHAHAMHSLVEGKNDVQVCDCGAMSRKFDLATAFSESWSEGTAKTDALWRQLGGKPGYLDSGNWISHINDSVYQGNHNDEYWIEIGVEFAGDQDIEVDLSLCAGISGSKNWSVLNIKVNDEKIENNALIENCGGWDNFLLNKFGTITLKAHQINRIRISPNQGCEMNWCYLQIDSEIATIDSTQKLIDAAR